MLQIEISYQLLIVWLEHAAKYSLDVEHWKHIIIGVSWGRDYRGMSALQCKDRHNQPHDIVQACQRLLVVTVAIAIIIIHQQTLRYISIIQLRDY